MRKIIAIFLLLMFSLVACKSENSSSNLSLSTNTAKEHFEKILNNEQDFYLTYDKTSISISDYNLKASSYAYVDMDNDNIDELAIMFEGGDILILRIDGESIIGYEFGHRAMASIYTDGCFLWNQDSENTYGCSRLKFKGKIYKEIELWRVENANSAVTAYYIDGRTVTKEEFISFNDENEYQYIKWNSLPASF